MQVLSVILVRTESVSCVRHFPYAISLAVVIDNSTVGLVRGFAALPLGFSRSSLTFQRSNDGCASAFYDIGTL